MPLWFVRGLRRGVVTTRYPARPDASAASLPTPPAFRPSQLTREAADLMVAVCPSLALSRRDDMLVFDVGACTACGRCAAVAPDVVTASRAFELATTARSALIKEIPIRGDEP
jgi:ferredoxin-like protein FixX